MIIDKVPQSLRQLDQWVVWRSVTRNAKPTKQPFQVNGDDAKSNDPSTWTTLEDVLSCDGFDGVGFMFGGDDPFCGIDLDGCRNDSTGEVAEWARAWIKRFNSYTEISPSRTGFKIFVRGTNSRSSGKNRTLDIEAMTDAKTPGVEIYDRLRYFTVTGLRVRGVSVAVEDRQEAINEFCDEFFPVTLPSVKSVVRQDSIDYRAKKYLEKIPPAVSGQGGHNQTFNAACVLVLGFGLPESQAIQLLNEWNVGCQPPWSEKELLHKVRSAAKQEGPRNYLRDVKIDDWGSVCVPEYAVEAPDLITLQGATEKYLDYLNSGKDMLVELGIADVDYAVGGGVAFGEMVVIAARPSHGKSAVALQCLDTSTRNGMNCLLISEEMSSLAIGKRAIQFASDTPEEHWKTSLSEVTRDLSSHFEKRAKCFVAEGCRTSDRISEVVDYAVTNHGVRVVAVDYAQLIQSKGSNRYEQITNTSVALRQLANAHDIVVIVLAQLNRQIESREQFMPKMSDLKDSGQIEQDADVILLLVWPHRIDTKNDPYKYHVYVGKNRNRAINQMAVECKFHPSRQMFLHDSPREDGKINGTGRVAAFDDWNERGRA